MEQAWSHLVQLGHRRIGLVLGPVDHIPSRRKLTAARRAAAQSGLSLDDDQVVHSHYSLEAGQAATARLLASGVTAVICASDPLALGAVRAVRRAGKNVPADVSNSVVVSPDTVCGTVLPMSASGHTNEPSCTRTSKGKPFASAPSTTTVTV